MTPPAWRPAWAVPLLLFLVLVIFPGLPIRAAETQARVNADRVNVRSRPGFVGEVFARLNLNQEVRVLGQVVLPKPAPGEPARWARIALPPGTRVWASAEFVDAASKSTTADVLNLRAGPSYDHGYVGRVVKGTRVEPVGEPKDGWLPIASPPGCHGFVPEMYLLMPSAAPAPAPAPTPTPASPPPSPASASTPSPAKPPTAAATPAPTTSAPAPSQPFPQAPAPPPPSTTSAPPPAPATQEVTPHVMPTPPPDPAPATTPPPPPDAAPSPEPAPTAPTDTGSLDDFRGRKVRREGIVVRPTNIQAPSHYALQARDSRRKINFLLTTREEPIPWQEYRGKVVIVTGREYLDQRPLWSDVPLLDVETIEAVR